MELLSNWNSYFQNPDLINCPIESCQLKDQDCEEDIEQTNLTMSDDFPYEIKGKQNIDEGWNITVCLECVVNNTKTIFANYSIRQIRDCETHISKTTTRDDIVYYAYDEVKQSYMNATRLFSWTGEEFCGEVECTLHPNTCSGTI